MLPVISDGRGQEVYNERDYSNYYGFHSDLFGGLLRLLSLFESHLVCTVRAFIS